MEPQLGLGAAAAVQEGQESAEPVEPLLLGRHRRQHRHRDRKRSVLICAAAHAAGSQNGLRGPGTQMRSCY